MMGEVNVIRVLSLIKLENVRYNNNINKITIRSRYTHGYSVPLQLQDNVFVPTICIMVEVSRKQ